MKIFTSARKISMSIGIILTLVVPARAQVWSATWGSLTSTDVPTVVGNVTATNATLTGGTGTANNADGLSCTGWPTANAGVTEYSVPYYTLTITNTSANTEYMNDITFTNETNSTAIGFEMWYGSTEVELADLTVDATQGVVGFNIAIASGATATFTVSFIDVKSGKTAGFTSFTISGVTCSTSPVTYTVGPGANYATLTAAAADYNYVAICGPVIYSLQSNYVSTGETFPIVFDANAGSSATNTTTIEPASGVSALTISGSSKNSVILELAGATYFTVNGAAGGTGTTRNLTITNTNTAGTTSSMVWVTNSASAGASYNTIENCIISSSSNSKSLAGIISCGTTLENAPTYANNHNTYQNNSISTAIWGISLIGPTSDVETGNVITGNTIGSATTANMISQQGMYLDYETNMQVIANTISGVYNTIGGIISGIDLATGINGATISGNTIGNINNTESGYGCDGIYSTGTTNSSIYNNFIWNVWESTGNATVADNGHGIYLVSGSGYTIDYNSIYLGTNETAAGITAGMYVASGVTGLTIENNIFDDAETTPTAYGIYSAEALAGYTTIDYNNYIGHTGLGYLGGAQTSVGAMGTAFGGNTHSLNVTPAFVAASTGNLNLTSADAALEAGTPLSSLTTVDINNMTRATPPYMGAAEFATLSATNLASFGALNCLNTPSGPNTFTLTGSALASGTITVGPLTGFTFCTTSGGTYQTSLSLSESGNAYSQVIYVIFSEATAGSYNGFIPVSGGGANSINVADTASAVGCSSPTLAASPLASFGNVCAGFTVGPDSFTISGSVLTSDNVTVGSLTGFTFSTTYGGTYQSSLSLVQPGGTYSQTIYVDFSPTAVQSYSGNIVLGGGGASSINVAASAAGVGDPSITLGSNPLVCYSAGTQPANLTFSSPTNCSTYSISGWSGGSFANVTNAAIPGSSPFVISVPPATAGATYDANLTVSNASCSSSNYAISVTVNPAPSAVTVSPTAPVTCPGPQLLTASGGTGGTIYFQGTTSNGTSGIAETSASVTSSGTYYFNAQSSLGCWSTQGSSNVSIGLSGTYTIPGSFPTLTDAVAAYNASPICNPVIFQLTSSYTSSGETYPIKIMANTGASASNTLTIEPATGATPTISGASASAAIIEILGDYVIINGSAGGTGTSQNLTVQNTSTTAPYVVSIGSAGTTPVTNVTVENCLLPDGSNSTGYGIVIQDEGLSNPGYFNNITIQNNTVETAFLGIQADAVVTGTNGNGLLITGNNLATTGSTAIGYYGIYVVGVYGATVSNNTVGNFAGTNNGEDPSNVGIWFTGSTNNSSISGNTVSGLTYTGNTSAYAPFGIYATPDLAGANISITGNTVAGITTSGSAVAVGIQLENNDEASSGFTIENNRISNITNTDAGGGPAAGIALATTSTTAATTIANNYIWGVTGYGKSTALDNGTGIYIENGGGYSIYFNSIYMGTNQTSASSVTSAVYVAAAASKLVIENNIFDDAETVGSTYGIYSLAAATAYTTINYNDYVGTTGWGYLGSARTSASAMNTGFGGNLNSISFPPVFVSNTNLNLQSSGNLTLQAGVSGTGITTDIIDNPRGVIPYMGAYEIQGGPNYAGATAIVTPVPFCPGTSAVQTTITNFGSSNLTSVNVFWSINGVSQGSVSPSVSLTPGSSTTVSLGTYTFSDGIPYTIYDSAYAPNGQPNYSTANTATNITVYAGMPATVYVGSGSGTPSYATFSSLFSAINSSTLDKNLNVYVQGSTTEPSTPTFLNAATVCSGTDTIFIQPVSATSFTISGSTASSSYPGVIGFNGATNVIVNGSYNGSGQYLNFVQDHAGYSDLVFQNNSNSIIVENCAFNTGVTTNTAPLISFGTSSATGTGNSYITLSGNNIGSTNGDTYWSPADIASNYSSAASSALNANNTITGNNIFNFAAQAGGRGYGIDVTATGNGSNWNISNNSIYNTAVNTVGTQTGIYFLPGTSSTGDSISNNYIGGSGPACSSSGLGYWENDYVNGCTLNELDIINVNTGNISISGNLIERINNQDGNNSGLVVMTVAGTTATIANNTLGNSDAVTNDEIFESGGATTSCAPGYIYGVLSTTTSTLTITANAMFYLFEAGGDYGGTVYNVWHKGTGPVSISNNLLLGTQTGGINGNSFSIWVAPTATTTGNVINNNIIDGPYITGSTASADAITNIAININPSSGASGSIYDNTIFYMPNSQNSGLTQGMLLQGAGTWNVYDNEISLPNLSTNTNLINLYGIVDQLTSTAVASYYYNSIYLYAAVAGGYSYSFLRFPGGSGTVAGSTIKLENNIIINANTGGGANTYAIANFGSSNYATNWSSGASNYNFVANNMSGYANCWGTTPETFATWQTGNGITSDANSQNASISTSASSSTALYPPQLFVNPDIGDLDIIPTSANAPWPYSFVTGQALAIPATVSTDIHGTVRSTQAVPAGPTIGCDETADVVYTWTGNTSSDWTITTNWSPASPIGGPNSCAADVIIPVTGTSPVLSAPASAGNVQINSGATLTDNATLSVCKNWTGGSGTNGTIAGSGQVVLTGSSPQIISGTTQFNELNLDNSQGAAIQAGATVNISNALDLESGQLDASAGTLNLLSTSVTQAAIIDNFSEGNSGTLIGNINAQRYYAAAGLARFQHLMGSPVSAPALSQFGASGTAGFVVPKASCDELQMATGSPYGTVFSYHENPALNPNIGSCGEAQWKVETSGSAVNGMGYSILKYTAGTLTLNGAANLNSSYVVSGYTANTLTNSGWENTSLQSRDMSSGWQLLSNPYSATLQLTTVNAGFDNQVQVWNTTGAHAGSYTVGMVGTDAVVAPFQAFMVLKTAVGGSADYTINGTDRVRTTQTFFAQNDNELDITAQNIETGLLDNTTIAFNQHATDGFDPQYDADKLGGSLNRHTLYSLNQNKWMAINVLNSVNTTSTVAVGFEPGATGNYTFTFNNLNTFDPTTYIYLEDKQAGVMYNVRNGNYQFSSDSADEWNRFVIHFTPPIQIATQNSSCDEKGSIKVIQPGTANWNYIITNANNVTVATGVLNQSSPVNVSADAGTYTIQLVDNNNYTVTKVIQVSGAPVAIASFNAPANASAQTTVSFTSTSQNAVQYNWYFSDGGIVTGVSDATYTFNELGTYIVMLEITNAAGCTSSITKNITITGAATAIQNINGNGDINMWSYANRVYVDFSQLSNVNATIKIYNILGQEISADRFSNNALYEKQIDNIDAAYIIVSVKNDDKITTKKLFVVNTK